MAAIAIRRKLQTIKQISTGLCLEGMVLGKSLSR